MNFSYIIDFPKEELYKELCEASVVVSTPSTTAMEALVLGKPVLLVKTSNDQTGQFVEDSYAEWYTPELLSLYLRNEYIRKSMSEKRIVNNSIKVVDMIYQEWSKWRQQQ